MTRDNIDSSDLFAEADAPILEDLERAYTSTPTAGLRREMDRAVYARIAAPPPATAPRSRLRRQWRWPLPVVAAVVVVLGTMAGYLRAGSLTPVSAQSVLRRAAAVRLPPNSALHLVYRATVTVPGQSGTTHSGTADTWIESDAAGSPIRSAQTLTLDVKNIVSRYIQAGGETYAYDPELHNDNTIAVSPEARIDPSWLVPNHMFDGQTVAQYLNAPSQQQRVERLPDQTLDGHPVDVVRVVGGANRRALQTTLYFDAHTYLLRGFDATSIDSSYPIPTWQVRLTGKSTMPASSAPPGAFTLNAPADAQVTLPAPDFAGFATSFQSACHSTLSLKAAMGSGQTPLAVCRQTNPDVTETQLIDALSAPTRHDLETALAAGQLSTGQEATALKNLQTEVTTFVTTSRNGT